MPIPRKGLPDIRTHAGSVDRSFLPHRAYLKLSCLEMERFRRGKERQSAARRLQMIDERFREIDVEEAKLAGVLDEHKRDPQPRERAPSAARAGPKLRY